MASLQQSERVEPRVSLLIGRAELRRSSMLGWIEGRQGFT